MLNKILAGIKAQKLKQTSMIHQFYQIIDLIQEYDKRYNLEDIDPDYLDTIREKIAEIKPFEDYIEVLNKKLENADSDALVPLIIELRAVLISMAELFEEINDLKRRILGNHPSITSSQLKEIMAGNCTICHYQYDHQELREPIEKHPLMNKRKLMQLYLMAHHVSDKLDERMPGKQFLLSIGQSPAYLLEMIKSIDEQKGRKDRTYLHVAFSDTAFGPKSKKNNYNESVLNELERRLVYFKEYLNALGLTNDNLKKLKLEGIQPVAIDFCRYGSSLDSFLSFFEENLFLALYFQSADTLENVLNTRYSFMVDGIKIPLAWKKHNYLIELANSDNFDDRLVPHFHLCRWGIIDPLQFKPSENTNIILKKIKQFVATKQKKLFSNVTKM